MKITSNTYSILLVLAAILVLNVASEKVTKPSFEETVLSALEAQNKSPVATDETDECVCATTDTPTVANSTPDDNGEECDAKPEAPLEVESTKESAGPVEIPIKHDEPKYELVDQEKKETIPSEADLKVKSNLKEKKPIKKQDKKENQRSKRETKKGNNKDSKKSKKSSSQKGVKGQKSKSSKSKKESKKEAKKN